ncbi:hypothetical protein NL676_000679 [Syzygium grande]|nr:hypothetical protein NL676_000679 [Syzygium grande]
MREFDWPVTVVEKEERGGVLEGSDLWLRLNHGGAVRCRLQSVVELVAVVGAGQFCRCHLMSPARNGAADVSTRSVFFPPPRQRSTPKLRWSWRVPWPTLRFDCGISGPSKRVHGPIRTVPFSSGPITVVFFAGEVPSAAYGHRNAVRFAFRDFLFWVKRVGYEHCYFPTFDLDCAVHL